MLNPLVIVPAYTNSSDAVGQVERRFFSNLPKDKFRPCIVCKNWGRFVDNDYINVIRVHELKSVVFLDKVIRKLRLTDLTYLPDYQRFSWGNNAAKKALAYIKKNHCDYIHTISNPCSAHLVGLKIKQKIDVPWVAQFYDPWIDNPCRVINNPYFRDYDKKLERAIAEKADIIIHSNERMIEVWIKRYGDVVKDKMVVLPFISENPLIYNEENKPQDKITISHIGHFQRMRTSQTFINAIYKILLKRPDLINRLKVNYVGRVTEEEKLLIKKYNLEGVFNLVGSLSEEECLPYFKESDIFLVVDINHENDVFFPSKILKYFSYQKPILGITSKNSVLEHELISSGNFHFRYGDVDGVFEFLIKAITNYKSIITFKKNYWEKFSVENVIGSYYKIIRNMLETFYMIK